MQIKRYLVWSKRDLDLTDLWQRRWFMQQVLTHGRAEDVAALDWQEIERALPELSLPSDVRRLWEHYFRHVGDGSPARPGDGPHRTGP